MAGSKNNDGVRVPAVDRAAQILQAVAASETAPGISELSRQLHLNKSTTHDILATLCHHHLLERDDATKTYRLGYALAELGHRANERMDLRTAAHPRLVTLAHAVEETVILGTFHDGQVTIVDREEAPHDVKITAPLGRRLHYSAGVFGKIFLAAIPELEARRLIREKPLRAFTPKSVTKITAYRAALSQVRRQGYALDDEEYMVGVRAAGAPIVDAPGRVVAALCVVGFSARLPHDTLVRVARQTRDAAEDISRQLGAGEYPAWKGMA